MFDSPQFSLCYDSLRCYLYLTLLDSNCAVLFLVCRLHVPQDSALAAGKREFDIHPARGSVEPFGEQVITLSKYVYFRNNVYLQNTV